MNTLFFNEWVAGFCRSGYLPISTACNSDCVFCTNKYNPFPCQSGLFRDMEDIKLQLSLMSDHQSSINLSSVLPGRLPEGEAFLHPGFFMILDMVREKYPSNPLIICSNGSTFNKDYLHTLEAYKPVNIIVSLPTVDPDKLAFLVNRPLSFARKSLATVSSIEDYEIGFSGSIVPLPNFLGWKDIENTARFFLSHKAKELIFHYPGYTSKTPKHIVEMIACDLDEFTDFTHELRNSWKINIHAYPDMKTPIDMVLDRIASQLANEKPVKKNDDFNNVLWLTSEAAYPRLKESIEKHDHGQYRHHLHPVKNRSFGGNVIVGGLLLVDDFIEAGREALHIYPQTDLILLPSAPFDAFQRDLRYVPARKIAYQLERNAAMIDERSMVLLGRH